MLSRINLLSRMRWGFGCGFWGISCVNYSIHWHVLWGMLWVIDWYLVMLLSMKYLHRIRAWTAVMSSCRRACGLMDFIVEDLGRLVRSDEKDRPKASDRCPTHEAQ